MVPRAGNQHLVDYARELRRLSSDKSDARFRCQFASLPRCAVEIALASICAHLCHLAAIRLHVSLLAGSRAVFAIDSHSLARVKNSSGVCIERPQMWPIAL